MKVRVDAVPDRYRPKLEEHAELERARAQQQRAQQAPRDEAGKFRSKGRRS